MSTLVFLGPSLPLDQARAMLPGARFLPPAARGDLYRAARALAPREILLIDGVFHRRRAVWHREILWALSQGIAVLGAASMGALRAVELAAFGMRGIGRIHAAYADGRLPPFDEPFDDDAEVAVAHGPAELGAQALTLALVDLRCLFAASCAEGSISRAACFALSARCGAIHFADRTPERVREVLATSGLDAQARDLLLARIEDPAQSAKRVDAIAALASLAGRRAPATLPPAFTMANALVWEEFRQAAEQSMRDEDPDSEALDELRLLPPAWEAWRAIALADHASADGAGIEARIAQLLRAQGAFAPLQVRAARKRALLGPPAAQLAIGQARALRLLAWFRSRIAGDGLAQPSAAGLLAATGCRDEAALLRLLERELRFVEEAARRSEPA